MIFASLALSGCSTFSFAPPRVEAQRVLNKSNPTQCSQFAESGAEPISLDVDGAVVLIDHFVEAYRCAAREAADGRQVFQVPAMLALVAAAVGPTFGLDTDGQIAAATGAAVYGRANTYYAPKEKAKILDSAIDATLCVQTASVGVEFFNSNPTPPKSVTTAVNALREDMTAIGTEVQQLYQERTALTGRQEAIETLINGLSGDLQNPRVLSARERQAQLSGQIGSVEQTIRLKNAQIEVIRVKLLEIATMAVNRYAATQLFLEKDLPDGTTVKINVPMAYFRMVSASLLSVDRILSQRLSDVGTFDAAGLAAEMTQIIEAKTKAQADKDAAKKAQPPGGGAATMAFIQQQNANVIDLDLKLLQPKLQECVLRAKL